jgi:hypothetical protein
MNLSQEVTGRRMEEDIIRVTNDLLEVYSSLRHKT